MFGPMIVRRTPKRDQLRNLYDFDEHTMMISDWDHELGLDKFLAHYHGGRDNKPPNLLINGFGRFDAPDVKGEPGITTLMPTATFNVKQVSVNFYLFIDFSIWLSCGSNFGSFILWLMMFINLRVNFG